MNSKELRELAEAYQQVYASQEEIDEATAMAKRGYDETKLRKRAGGGEAADRATALEKKPTFGNDKAAKQRSDYARKQRGDFRKTASSSPGLHGYGHQSNDPKVQAKQAARGAQRGALTPNEKKQLNMGEELDIFDVVLEFLYVEGYAETLEEAEWMMGNIIDEEAIDIILGEELTGERLKRAETKMKSLGRRKSTLPSREALSRVSIGKEGTGVQGGRKGPVKRGGGGTAGRAKVSGTGGDDMDRGSGNKAARRAANEEFELWVNSLVEEGYDLSDYTWDEMYEFYLDEAEKPFPYEKVKAKQVALRGKGGNALDRRMTMGMAVRRAKEAEKTGGSQRDAGKGWYHAKEEFEAWLDEAMTKYERNRKRAAQRAAARNAARDQGKTGAVPGVGYVTPRRERETWTDESGKTRHAKGL